MNSSGQPIVPSGVLGGGALKADDYAAFLAREYMTGYVPAGGAAVKAVVVGDGGAADRLESALAAATAEHQGLYVSLSAESTRVHMVDQIFFAVSRAVARFPTTSNSSPLTTEPIRRTAYRMC